MGTVYLARSRGGRAVAVKVARPELAADPSFRARFRAEVAAARQVGGFHTAQVVDADPEAEAPWLATAYIPGPTLSGLLTAQGPMDEARLRSLGAALAEALEAIHACGLVHRDLKPGNIVMAPTGPASWTSGSPAPWSPPGSPPPATPSAPRLPRPRTGPRRGSPAPPTSSPSAPSSSPPPAAAPSVRARRWASCTGRSTRPPTSPPYRSPCATSWAAASPRTRPNGPPPTP
ncbi:phosphotransferase [Streptomyces diastatochromogenes]|nr:phosphotransferase [Streptomyces diastatochromogenes]